MTLAWIPKGILARIQNISCRFLWKGNNQGRIFSWDKWDTIARPRRWGGWGIKRLELLSKALATKLGWQLVHSTNLWTKVSFAKYVSPSHIMDWIRHDQRASSNIFIIWKLVINSINLIQYGLTWRILSGSSIRIGANPWIGCGNAHRLPVDLKHYLAGQGITNICHIADAVHYSMF